MRQPVRNSNRVSNGRSNGRSIAPCRAPAAVLRALAVVTLLSGLGAPSPAPAADFPAPRVMSDAPPDKGRWRMEMLEINGRDASATQKAVGGEMTVCMTAAEAASRREAAADRQKCDTRMVEDTASRAVVEVTCTGDSPVRTRSTITRTGDREYLVATDVQSANPTSMKMRMSYAGTCAAGDNVVSLGKDSAVCRKAREKVASGEAAKQCASGGEDEARCKARMAQVQARIESLCK